MNTSNVVAAIGIIGSVVSILAFFDTIFRGSKDLRLPVFTLVVTIVVGCAAYFALPRTEDGIARLEHEVSQLRIANEQMVQLVIGLGGRIPTKEQVDQLEALVRSYRFEIEKLKAALTQVSDEDATRVKSVLASMEKDLQKLETVQEEYARIYNENLKLPRQLAGRWFFLKPFDVEAKVGLVDGVEFKASGQVAFLERGKQSDLYRDFTRYALVAPWIIRFYGKGNRVEDYGIDFSDNTLGLTEVGSLQRTDAIRMGPGLLDHQLSLEIPMLKGRWKSTPENCSACRDTNMVLSMSLDAVSAAFEVYSFDWFQLVRDPYEFTAMKPQRFDFNFTVSDKDHVDFSGFPGEKGSVRWRAQLFDKYLELQAEAGSTQHSFIRY